MIEHKIQNVEMFSLLGVLYWCDAGYIREYYKASGGKSDFHAGARARRTAGFDPEGFINCRPVGLTNARECDSTNSTKIWTAGQFPVPIYSGQ